MDSRKQSTNIGVDNKSMKKLLSREDYFKFLKERPLDYCPFCYQKAQDVIVASKYWIWIANKAPYWRYSTLLVPKRHFCKFTDITQEEFIDFIKIFKQALKKYRAAKIKINGVTVKKYLFLWTERDDFFDTIWKVTKPEHYHFHIMPDKEHSFDPLLDKTACKYDTVKKLK